MNKDDLAYSLRLQSKRTDIPTDVVRSLSEAYQALQMTQNDQPEPVFRGASHMLHDELALHHGTVAMNDPKSLSEAEQALQDVTEGVTEMEIEIARLRAELKTSNAERDEARRQVCDWYNTDESGCVKSGSHETARARGWDCFKNQETT